MAARGSDLDRTDALYAFWSMLTLEMLGRTTLAAVHPALLADPTTGGGASLLYAVGYEQPGRPRSVPAKTVFARCTVVVDDFTKDDAALALAFLEMRNDELHSGATPFDDLQTATWLADYYRLTQTLLTSFDKELEDLFDESEAEAARRMIDAAAEELAGDVRKWIQEKHQAWRGLSAEESERRRASATRMVEAEVEKRRFLPHAASTARDCPACGTPGLLVGDVVTSGSPRMEDELIVHTITKLPSTFSCIACGLQLEGHGALHAAGLGGVFTMDLQEHPEDYYGLDQAGENSEYEPDYGND